MPSIVTHHLFAEDVLKSLTKNIQQQLIINENIYYIFAQSFDNLFYYKFLTPWIGKKIRNFGNDAQKMKINLYFGNIIEYIETHSTNRLELLAYLYGSICHYVLDAICHPYIFYYTGDAHENRRYRGLHEKMEVNIDAYLFKEKKGKDLKNEELARYLLPKENFSSSLKMALDDIFIKTFDIPKIGTKYAQSVNTGRLLLKYFVTDKNGIKKKIYKIKDIITFWSIRKYEYLSFNVTKINTDYLNEDHNEWFSPIDFKNVHTQSFIDLYIEALHKSVDLIENIEKYWHHSISKTEILKQIGNNSYVTGVDCLSQAKMKYFKY